MASIEQATHDILKAHAGVTAMVADRIAPLHHAQGEARPSLTYTISGYPDAESVRSLDGPSGWDKVDMEIGIYADTLSQCLQLAQQVKSALHFWGGTISNVEIAPSLFEDESDIEQAYPPGSEKPVYVRTQTYRILYRNH